MAKEGSAIVLGVGPGLGAALGRRFAKAGYAVALAARNLERVKTLAAAIAAQGGAARAYATDATDAGAVQALVAHAEAELGPLEVAIYNASGRVRKSILDLEADEFEAAWRRACLGGFLLGREAARRMVPRGRGTILFTGATASVKAIAGSAGFAVGKFGLRALAQSMARELAPKGVHVGHAVIDGGIGVDAGQARLDPDAIAEAYYQLHAQPKSAWTWEIELRPWVETF
jgi:NAD(P)-dependent dehydrogenase (short-subunit alcohol dehydrogenase family)